MEDTSNKIYENINSLYEKAGYIQRYGTDILIVVIILVICFIGLSYFSFLNRIKPIKSNWTQERCNPQVIPFAGLIHKKEGQSVLEATSENFQECSQTTLQNISSYAMSPIYYLVHIINETFKEFGDGINSARGMFNNVRDSVKNVGQNVYNRSLNVVIPFQEYFIAIKSALGKVSGIATASIYTLFGSYLALKSMIGAIIEVVIIIMIALASLIAILWILPFTWPVAASMSAVFLAILIPLIILTVTLQDVFKGSVKGQLPGMPSCFDENTILEFEDNIQITISKLNKTHIGKILKGGNKITSILKLSTQNNQMYVINNILVSGSHRILYNGEFIRVENHPNRKIVQNYDKPYIYCLNTDTGKFIINNETFLDYDDLLDNDIQTLKEQSLWLNLNKESKLNKKDIYKYFDCGFDIGTLVEMNEGGNKFISECQVGDILRGNIKVLGKVVLDSNLNDIFLYNSSFLGGGNIIKIESRYLDFLNILSKDDKHKIKFTRASSQIKIKPKAAYLYNLLTDKGIIPINNEYFGDYNSGLDVPLHFFLE